MTEHNKTTRSLVETVGRALADAEQEDYMEDCVRYDRQARAAIRAMRVPTDVQLNAARDWSICKNGIGVGNDQATGCYQAMIDAGVSEL